MPFSKSFILLFILISISGHNCLAQIDWVVEPTPCKSIKKLYQDYFAVEYVDGTAILDADGNELYKDDFKIGSHLNGKSPNIPLSKNGLVGIYNVNKGLICPAVYHSAKPINDDFIIVTKYGMSAMINSSNELLVDYRKELNAKLYQDSLMRVSTYQEKKRIDRFYDKDGLREDIEYVDEDRYQYDSKGNEYRVFVGRGRLGLIKNEMDTILKPQYFEISLRDKDVWYVKEGTKRGLFSIEGDTILPTIYSAIGNGNGTLFTVTKDRKSNLSNYKGELLYPEFKSGIKMIDSTYILVNISTNEQAQYEWLDAKGNSLLKADCQRLYYQNKTFKCTNSDNSKSLFNYNLELILDSVRQIKAINDSTLYYDDYDKNRGVISNTGTLLYEPMEEFHATVGEFTIWRNIETSVMRVKDFNKKVFIKEYSRLREKLTHIKDLYTLGNSKDGYYIIDRSGNKLLPDRYTEVKPIYKWPYYTVKIDEKIGLFRLSSE